MLNLNIVGIIAEYNPFHKGHLYHLHEATKRTQADGVVCIMSGNFLQRGEPAIVNKWARAKMAIHQGIDLVFELPVLYATRSAYWFARGSIESLAKTNIVSHLAYGVETPDPSLLQEAAGILAAESLPYQTDLKRFLKVGHSYPRARAKALAKALEKTPEKEIPYNFSFLESSNNILALAYLQVIEELSLSLIPLMIERLGSGYLDNSLQTGTLPSATAIRNYLTRETPNFLASLNEPPLSEHLPEATIHILKEEYQRGQAPVSLHSLTPQLMTLLRRSSLKELQQIVDISEGLENRIKKISLQSTNLEEFLSKLKTKRFTYTRLQRFLIHLLINYTKDKESYLLDGPPYLHLLGFTPRGQELLKEIKKKSTIPVITKGAHINKYLQTNAHLRCFWESDLLATNLYTLLYPGTAVREGNLDYLHDPVF